MNFVIEIGNDYTYTTFIQASVGYDAIDHDLFRVTRKPKLMQWCTYIYTNQQTSRTYDISLLLNVVI
jgi:hypothetical protein